MKMIQAQVYRQNDWLGKRWVCRLYEPGGYRWHGQVVNTSFADMSVEEFIVESERNSGIKFDKVYDEYKQCIR